MTLSEMAVAQLHAARDQFHTSTGTLDAVPESFRPREEMMTAAQHIAHAAQVIDWLVQGAFSPAGFDLDFEAQIQRVLAIPTLTAARAWFDRAMNQAIDAFATQPDAALLTPLPPGPVLGGMPRFLVAAAIAEHTSHHRGALSVYARLHDVVPPSPYGI